MNMLDVTLQKPSFDSWERWTEIIVDHLTKAVHVYNKPPHEDASLREEIRQGKVETLINLIRSLHGQIESGATIKSLSLSEQTSVDDHVIAGLCPLMDQVIKILPTLSDDMQFMLKSPWHENCTGRVAKEIFCGTGMNVNEGIGSGRAEHGRLPEILTDMLEQEFLGTVRPPRVARVEETGMAARNALIRRRKASSAGSAGRVD